MYVPRAYRMTDDEARAFIRATGFAILTGPGPDDALTATHLPLLLQDPTPDHPRGRLVGHMARANRHWRHLDGREALAVFSGPHAYISPAWYGRWPNVPTWAYLAVHVRGRFQVIQDEAAVARLLRELVAWFEPASALLDHLDEEVYDAERQGVVGFELTVDVLEGAKKLAQTHPADERAGVVAGLMATGDPMNQAVARLITELDAHP
jgi:transcriptional regulator